MSGAPASSGGGVQHASFSALMTHYTGDTKTLLDSGTCYTKATTAWTTVTAVFTSTFTTISTTGDNATAINAFLSSEPGQSFKNYMLSRTSLTKSIENFIVPAAGILASEPTGAASGASGQTGGNTTDHVTQCLRNAGIGVDDDANTAELPKRLNTLNCLAFQTPHQYWLDLADDTYTSDLNSYKAAVNNVSWLSYGDLECSVPDRLLFLADLDSPAEKASCLKHDLSWGTLQAMSGNTALSESEDDNELDDAHNPRNKFLADFTFYIENVCADEPEDERSKCLAKPVHQTRVLGSIWAFDPEYRKFWAVAKVTDRSWPVTREDVDHAYATPRYVYCQPPTPSLTDLRLSIHNANFSIFKVEYRVVDNCTGVEIDFIALCPSSNFPCTRIEDDGLFLPTLTPVLPIATIRLYPEKGVYGGRYYTIEINRTLPDD